MHTLARRASLTMAAAVAAATLGSMPASADTSGAFSYFATPGGVAITGWAGSSNCPAVLEIPSALGGLPVVNIDGNAFPDKTCMSPSGATKSLTIPASVTTIGAGAFSANAGLTSVTFLGGLASLPSQAFAGDSSLTTITFLAGGPAFAGDTFSGVPASANVFYRAGTTLRSGADWGAMYGPFHAYVLPEIGIAGALAGVSHKSKKVFFFPTVVATATGTASVAIYAKVKKKGKYKLVFMCWSQKAATPNALVTVDCTSKAARALVRKRATTFVVHAWFTQDGSGYKTDIVSSSFKVKRRK